jgi:UDP-N-acetylmuramate dehydrogenase
MIRQNISLLPYNTFGIDAEAAFFTECDSVTALREALREAPVQSVFILGGGSNILLTNRLEQYVIKNNIRGIEIVRQFSNRIWVKVGGGEVWHDVVLWAVQQGYGGLENLSLIPGSVGAAPVQNIGAYGVELKDVLVSVEAMALATGKIRHFSRKTCRFGYRESIFKHEAKGKYAIVSVTFSLTTTKHQINVNYGDIQKTLAQMNVQTPTVADVSAAVVQIRTSKLPDPAKIGNCGSFFKNPEVERTVLERIRSQYPNAPAYDLPDGRVKIPAGWLIEQCGWKGKRVGNTGCYEKQALVLVNHGGATGTEVRQLAHDIIASVEEKFGIQLTPEVNIL